MILRDYQKECVETIKQNFKKEQSQLVQLPTGSGKTVILWHYLKDTNERSLIVAPTRELLEQLYETGCQVLDKGDIYVKRHSNILQRKHTITTMQGLTWLMKLSKSKKLNYDILIIDEAHRAQAKTYREFIDKNILNTDRKCLGLTATPERLDGKNLLDIFGNLSFKRTLLDLIKQDYLTDILCYKIKTNIEIKNPKYANGEYTTKTLQQLDVPERNHIIKNLCLNECREKKTLIFCVSVSHAVFISKLLRESVLSSEAIYGDLSMTTRKELISKFRSGEIQFLTNCQLLTEGFDEPSIDALILARPTRSKSLYCQMVGRGVRPWNNKEYCYLYDLADNHFNIISFNSIGEVSDRDLRSDDVEQGLKLTDYISRIKKDISEVIEIDFDLEEVKLFNNEEIPILDNQVKLLKSKGIHFIEEYTTAEEAGFLLWKDKKLREYGIDTKDYWEKWKYSLSSADND